MTHHDVSILIKFLKSKISWLLRLRIARRFTAYHDILSKNTEEESRYADHNACKFNERLSVDGLQ